MQKPIKWLLWLALAALAWQAGQWAYQRFDTPAAPRPTQTEVLDIDKKCIIFPDTGQCVCRHKRTNERLYVDRNKCVSLAKGQR